MHSLICQRLMSLLMCPYAGSTATIDGLVGAPEHNGQRAALLSPVPATGRFLVELLHSGKKLRVRPANLTLTHAKPFKEGVGGIVVTLVGGQEGTLMEELSGAEGGAALWQVRLEGGSDVQVRLGDTTLVARHGGVLGGAYFERN